MNKSLATPLCLSATLSLSFGSFSASALACDGMEKTTASVQKVKVEQLAKAIKSRKPPTVLDANDPDTRARFGVIPGAVLLTNYASYSVTKELPKAKDKELVFYCAAEACSAAETAAKTAVKAGYTNVAVLPEGIKGWRSAGKKPSKSRS